MTDFNPPLNPGNAPFVAGTVPEGWGRPLTTEEADEANLLYPVPPYGDTYFPPGTNPEPPLSGLTLIQLDNVEAGNPTVAWLREGDAEKLGDVDTFAIWPIAGRAGILDDLPARSVRVLGRTGNRLTFNLDTDGLNVNGLRFLGIVNAAS